MPGRPSSFSKKRSLNPNHLKNSRSRATMQEASVIVGAPGWTESFEFKVNTSEFGTNVKLTSRVQGSGSFPLESYVFYTTAPGEERKRQGIDGVLGWTYLGGVAPTLTFVPGEYVIEGSDVVLRVTLSDEGIVTAASLSWERTQPVITTSFY